MIVAWMLYATVLAGLFGIAAALLENGLITLRLPTRWVCASAMLASIVVPAVGSYMPAQPVPKPLVSAAGIAQVSGQVESLPSIGFDVFRVLDPISGPLTVLWFTMSVLILTTLIWTAWRTRRHAIAWQPSRVGDVEVLYSASSGPAVVGCFPGTIVLPRWTRQLGAEWQAMMVMHEQEHVRARDTALIAGGLLCAALVPWNAMIWWQFKRLRHAVELDCDGRVLERGVDRRAYGELLIELTERGRRQVIPAVGFSTRKPLLSRRISVMMERTTQRLSLKVVIAGALSAVLVVIGCSMPTPPDAEDAGDFTFDESVAGRFGAEEKVQLANALDMVAQAERRLADHVMEESDTPASEVEQARRAQLEKALQQARGNYESLARRIKGERHHELTNGPNTFEFREPGAESDLHFGPDNDTRHKVRPIVYVDGVQQDESFLLRRIDDVGAITSQNGLEPDQIARIEILKGRAAVALDGVQGAPIIRITTKTNAEQSRGAN